MIMLAVCVSKDIAHINMSGKNNNSSTGSMSKETSVFTKIE